MQSERNNSDLRQRNWPEIDGQRSIWVLRYNKGNERDCYWFRGVCGLFIRNPSRPISDYDPTGWNISWNSIWQRFSWAKNKLATCHPGSSRKSCTSYGFWRDQLNKTTEGEINVHDIPLRTNLTRVFFHRRLLYSGWKKYSRPVEVIKMIACYITNQKPRNLFCTGVSIVRVRMY